MKVLMIASWFAPLTASAAAPQTLPGNPLLGSFFKEQAGMLRDAGVDVAILHASVGGRRGTGLCLETVDGVPTATYTRLNLTPRWEAGRCFQRERMLARAYRRLTAQWGRPDVVNLRSSLHGYEALALCRRERLPLFFMEHSSYVLTEPPNSPALARLRDVMRYAAVSAAVSGAVRDVMAPFGGTRVIPDPVDGDLFRPAPAPREDGAFVFRAMGQLRPIKGFDVLLRAFALVRGRTERPVKLDIAGVGGQEGALRALADALELGGGCRLVGAVPRSEAPAFMNGCDCFVVSSYTETLSCVLNEAAACGKPVVSTRCGGPLDIVTEETGLLVPPGDPEALAGAMLAMLDGAAAYDPARIRALTLERFGREAVVAKLLAACEDAARSGRGAR